MNNVAFRNTDKFHEGDEEKNGIKNEKSAAFKSSFGRKLDYQI